MYAALYDTINILRASLPAMRPLWRRGGGTPFPWGAKFGMARFGIANLGLSLVFIEGCRIWMSFFSNIAASPETIAKGKGT